MCSATAYAYSQPFFHTIDIIKEHLLMESEMGQAHSPLAYGSAIVYTLAKVLCPRQRSRLHIRYLCSPKYLQDTTI